MQAFKESGSQMKVFDELESEVRSYCRSFPTIFTKAKGYKVWDIDGREFIDFFSGAGALNYGHNNPKMKEKLLNYIASDGIMHGLDMATKAKEEFLKRFNEVILKPRKLKYKIMFPGPTGTNAVESALKLARKVTGRESIISFTNAFHGMTLGSLSITGNSFKRQGAGIPLNNSAFMPFDNYLGKDVDTINYIERYLKDNTEMGFLFPLLLSSKLFRVRVALMLPALTGSRESSRSVTTTISCLLLTIFRLAAGVRVLSSVLSLLTSSRILSACRNRLVGMDFHWL